MNDIMTEKQYQRYIIERLKENGYVESTNTNFDRLFALDLGMLFRFLEDTQP